MASRKYNLKAASQGDLIDTRGKSKEIRSSSAGVEDRALNAETRDFIEAEIAKRNTIEGREVEREQLGPDRTEFAQPESQDSKDKEVEEGQSDFDITVINVIVDESKTNELKDETLVQDPLSTDKRKDIQTWNSQIVLDNVENILNGGDTVNGSKTFKERLRGFCIKKKPAEVSIEKEAAGGSINNEASSALLKKKRRWYSTSAESDSPDTFGDSEQLPTVPCPTAIENETLSDHQSVGEAEQVKQPYPVIEGKNELSHNIERKTDETTDLHDAKRNARDYIKSELGFSDKSEFDPPQIPSRSQRFQIRVRRFFGKIRRVGRWRRG